ncbi:integrase arm-type DNA-binding domain-containing protein [Psychromonas hadalis]|uniref:integrase arm-type DNA-binding domain-containing protein n=1 Tax=Psychromonas hadalis TaxID=211669 RepID=UPI00041E8CEC|nr:integrase arm-type DNA-binding domain-containing protein [Psychromonas hadalis]
MNNKKIQAFIKTGKLTRKAIGDGLYIRVQTVGNATWEVRYTFKGKRKVIALEGGQYPHLSLADAKIETFKIKQLARAGEDPLAERARLKEETISTVDDLFADWYPSIEKRLKHPEITKRIYSKEIKPLIGYMQIVDVTPLQIRSVFIKVA